MKNENTMENIIDQIINGNSTSRGMSIEDNYIVIREKNSFTYEIPLDQCNTVCNALSWIMHMMEKNWVTQDKLETIVALMYRHANEVENRRNNGL